jgi:hypothetical protein
VAVALLEELANLDGALLRVDFLLGKAVRKDDGSARRPGWVLEQEGERRVLADKQRLVVGGSSTPDVMVVHKAGERRVGPSVVRLERSRRHICVRHQHERLERRVRAFDRHEQAERVDVLDRRPRVLEDGRERPLEPSVEDKEGRPARVLQRLVVVVVADGGDLLEDEGVAVSGKARRLRAEARRTTASESRWAAASR